MQAPSALTWVSRSPRLAALAAGAGHSALVILSQPPFNLNLLAVVAILPLIAFAHALAALPLAAPVPRPTPPTRFRALARNVRAVLSSPALLAGLASVPASLWLHRYLIDVAGPSYVPLAFYLALFPAAFVALSSSLIRATLYAPRLAPHRPRLLPILPLLMGCLWALLETLRGDWILGGYTFYNLAHPLVSEMAKIASVIGATGCGLLLVAVMCAIDAAIRFAKSEPKTFRVLVGYCIILALLHTAGPLGLLRNSDHLSAVPAFRIAVLQTNLPQSNKIGWAPEARLETFRRWLAASGAAARAGAQLIVWPETMFPGYSLSPEWTALERKVGLYLPLKPDTKSLGPPGQLLFHQMTELLLAEQKAFRVPMLIGSIGADQPRFDESLGRIVPAARYNSVFLIQNGQVLPERYDKSRLTPFGEFIPIAWRFPGIQQFIVGLGAKGMKFDLGFGGPPKLFTLQTAPAAPSPVAPTSTPATSSDPSPIPSSSASPRAVAIATPICFEVIYPETCRALVNAAPEGSLPILITPTNDGWFGTWNGGREAHLLQARWRAAELGVPIIRAVNTGISCTIDPRGDVVTGPNTTVPFSPDPTASGIQVTSTGPLAPDSEGVLITDVLGTPSMRPRATLYREWGEWPARSLAVAGSLAALFIIRRGRTTLIA